MKREIFRTILFAFTMFILFSCSHGSTIVIQKRNPASTHQQYTCTGMYDPYLETEVSLELTSTPLFFQAKIVESDEFDSDKKHPMQNQACYANHIQDQDKNFAKFETFIVPTSDARNSQGFACELSAIKISKNAGKDQKWPAVLFAKANQGDGIWVSCQ